jgi:iron complex outermembrane receptor protein
MNQTSNPSFRTVLALGTALGLFAAMPAWAQGAPQQTDAAADEGVEQIVVTARKRAEQLQDTPVSVTALSATAIEQRSVTSFNSLNNFVPNIELNNGRVDGGGSTAQIFIRGVGQEDYSFPNDPGVGVYLDGVYVSRSSAGDFGFLDIERIEVLRGPQGTLYGKNTIGGAINVITRKPDGETKGKLQLTYGRYDRIDFNASADFKISDTVFANISGASLNRDGYGTNFAGDDLGNQNKDIVRGQLRYQPNQDVDIILQADYSRQRQFGPVGAMRRFFPEFPLLDLYNTAVAPRFARQFGLTGAQAVYGPAFINKIDETKRYFSGAGTQTRDNNEIFGISLTADWAIGELDLKSISAYRQAKVDVNRDGDHTPFRIFDVAVRESTKQYSQEFQLNGEGFGGALEYILGVYVIRETGTNSFTAPLLLGVEEILGDILSLRTDTSIKSTSWAIFGEGTYNLTDNFGITLGARLNKDKKNYDYTLFRIFSGAVVNGPADLEKSWTEFLPKVGLEYKITDDVLTYASFSRGFKAGGWNPRTLSAGLTPQQFDPEYLNAFEVGVKSTLFDGRATFNLAGFYSDYKDIQLIGVTTTNGIVDTTVLNGGKARILGVEAELNARPIPQLSLSAGLGILDTKYKELDPGVISTGVPLTNKFIQAPSVTFNAQATYTIDLANQGQLLLNGDIAYKSKIYRSIQNFPDLITDPYWILNSRITYVAPEEAWEVALFVTNITNEIYLTNGVDVRGLAATEAYYSRPREWGISVTARF